MNLSKKFSFIKIKKVFISNFSLYSKRNKVETIHEEINNGVYCLAGANGLGKTTYLNIINYCLTGLVLEPGKKVYSPNEIEDSNKSFTQEYFKGRINEKDKANAKVEISFELNNKYYKIARGFESREKLKLLEIFSLKDGKQLELKAKDELELNEIYKKNLTKDMGIGNFEYFVFLQLYVLTFDENRRMIFWDENASTNALSIAFNDDLNDVDRIFDLKRNMDKLESDARNYRWQATQIKNEMNKLISNKKSSKHNHWFELKEIYDNLNYDLEKYRDLYRNLETEYDTLLKRQNIINSELLQLKTLYKKLFSQYSEPRTKLSNNKYVQYSKKHNECFLCGAKGNYIIENIERNIFKEKCPLCDTKISSNKNAVENNLFKQLDATDRQIDHKNNEIEELIYEAEAKKVDLEKAEYDFYLAKNELEQFIKDNSQVNLKETGDIPTDDLINKYEERFEKEDKKAKDSYKRRDKLKPEYENLLKKIDDSYKDAEEFFVPLFKKLAKSFIGLDLNIYFKTSGRNIVLNFQLLGTARTRSHQLSESQRFFLDIALRMALAIYLSKDENGSTLLIDTPEGSLDIAYESRVGKMFADFVVEYDQNIIMTANINASQLLITLAEKCTNEKMKFRRMLDWTDLTEIQKEGEYLFNQVYMNIENALNQHKYE